MCIPKALEKEMPQPMPTNDFQQATKSNSGQDVICDEGQYEADILAVTMGTGVSKPVTKQARLGL